MKSAWIKSNPLDHLGFLGGSDGEEAVCNAEELGLIPGSGRFPHRWEWYPLQYSDLGESHGQKSLVGYSSWDAKSQMQPSN